MATRAIAVLGMLLVPICNGCVRSARYDCTETGRIPSLQASYAPREDSSEELAQLLAYRSYFSLAEVGPYSHHFSVSLVCVETVLLSVAVTPDGVVYTDGPGWSGGGPAFIASRTPPPPIPASMQARADRVRQAVTAIYEGESNVRIAYEGSFRNVTVRESVPLDQPGDAKRGELYRQYTLSANANLTSIEPSRRDMTGGLTNLCMDTAWDMCARKPRWLPFVPSQPSASPQIAALLGAEPGADEAERARFEATMLDTARRVAAGGTGAPLAELLAIQGDGLLPANLSVPIAVGFEVHGRSDRVRQQSQLLALELPVADALFEEAGAATTGSSSVAGLDLTAKVWLQPDAPITRDAPGRYELPYTLRYRLQDQRENVREASLAMVGTFLVDGESMLALNLKIVGSEKMRSHEPPRAQTFPGLGDYRTFNTYLRIEARAR